MSVYMVFRHKIDMWTKTTSVNDAGQRLPSWALGTADIKCHFIPRVAFEQTGTTYDEWENIVIFFPANSAVTYGTRLYNLRDRYGNVIETGPLQVDGILKQPGFSGKVHHLVVKSKKVLES